MNSESPPIDKVSDGSSTDNAKQGELLPAFDLSALPALEIPGQFISQHGTDKLTRRPGLALLDRDLSALYVDASAHSERVLRSKDARRSHISEQK